MRPSSEEYTYLTLAVRVCSYEPGPADTGVAVKVSIGVAVIDDPNGEAGGGLTCHLITLGQDNKG